MTSLSALARQRAALTPVLAPAAWTVRVHRDGSYFTENPQGGGSGTRDAGSSIAATVARATANIPTGETVRVFVDDVDRGVYRIGDRP